MTVFLQTRMLEPLLSDIDRSRRVVGSVFFFAGGNTCAGSAVTVGNLQENYYRCSGFGATLCMQILVLGRGDPTRLISLFSGLALNKVGPLFPTYTSSPQ